MSVSGTAGGRIAPGVGANLIGQHAHDRNQDATVYVGNLDPQVRLYCATDSLGSVKQQLQACMTAAAVAAAVTQQRHSGSMLTWEAAATAVAIWAARRVILLCSSLFAAVHRSPRSLYGSCLHRQDR